MVEERYARHLYLPPLGRPRWKAQSTADWDIIYLFWGLRWYGDHPVPLSRREGWTYLVILEGAPTFVFSDGGVLETAPGMAIVYHPDCVRSAQDLPGRQTHVLGWIWKTPPNHARIQPQAGGYFKTMLSPEQFGPLEKIHAACRREVAAPGDTSRLALQKNKMELDLCLLHSLERPEPANQDYRIELALEYIRNNPQALDPVNRLCEYLQVSPATLKRIFHKYLGQSPQAYALEQRMLLAHEMLETGKKMVKEVAFELGYRHANDFSRAYSRFMRNARSEKAEADRER